MMETSLPTEATMRTYPCRRCGVPAGEACIDHRGNRKLRAHVAREHDALRDSSTYIPKEPLRRRSTRPDLQKRAEIERGFACEDCGAPAGERCRGKRQPLIEYSHRSRIEQARAAGL